MTIDDPNAEVPLHQLAGWEAEYYGQMVQSLDKGVNPLADSSEQIAFLNKKVEDYETGFEAAAAAHLAETGEELVVPVLPEKYELDLLRDLQKQVVMTLSDPEYIRSIEEMGADTFAPLVHTRIDEGLDYLGPDSLRPGGGGDIPPPLPPADFAGNAGYVDEVRDRSFSRNALAASEETLERQAAGLAEGDASVRSRAPVADTTPAGASASDADAGAAGTRSDLYNEPVSFEGRSLEGTPFSDDSKELAQSLDLAMGLNVGRSRGELMLIIGASNPLAWILVSEQVPVRIAEGVLWVSSDPVVLLLMINVLLFFVGMFLDTFPALIILTPILLPITKTIGVEPLHLGVIMVLNLMVGTVTPRVGVCLFIACNIGN